MNKNRQSIFFDETHSFMSFNYQWLDNFRENLNEIFEQFSECFNNLIEKNLSINEQLQFIEQLVTYIKTIQMICSNIRSTVLSDKQRQLKLYKRHLIKNSSNEFITENLKELLYELLRTLNKYIQRYSQAFSIPYQLEILDQDDQSIDFEQLIFTVVLY